jgi:hypothetical protein
MLVFCVVTASFIASVACWVDGVVFDAAGCVAAAAFAAATFRCVGFVGTGGFDFGASAATCGVAAASAAASAVAACEVDAACCASSFVCLALAFSATSSANPADSFGSNGCNVDTLSSGVGIVDGVGIDGVGIVDGVVGIVGVGVGCCAIVGVVAASSVGLFSVGLFFDAKDDWK